MRIVFSLLAIVIGASFVIADAQADTEVFYEGVLSYKVGHRHTLYEVSARLLSGSGTTNIVCTNALQDNGAISGDYRCAGTAAGALAVHPSAIASGDGGSLSRSTRSTP